MDETLVDYRVCTGQMNAPSGTQVQALVHSEARSMTNIEFRKKRMPFSLGLLRDAPESSGVLHDCDALRRRNARCSTHSTGYLVTAGGIPQMETCLVDKRSLFQALLMFTIGRRMESPFIYPYGTVSADECS